MCDQQALLNLADQRGRQSSVPLFQNPLFQNGAAASVSMPSNDTATGTPVPDGFALHPTSWEGTANPPMLPIALLPNVTDLHQTTTFGHVLPAGSLSHQLTHQNVQWTSGYGQQEQASSKIPTSHPPIQAPNGGAPAPRACTAYQHPTGAPRAMVSTSLLKICAQPCKLLEFLSTKGFCLTGGLVAREGGNKLLRTCKWLRAWKLLWAELRSRARLWAWKLLWDGLQSRSWKQLAALP
jgi:hypothetical protein